MGFTCHWTISWVRWMQLTILIISSHLHIALPVSILPSDILTNILPPMLVPWSDRCANWAMLSAAAGSLNRITQHWLISLWIPSLRSDRLWPRFWVTLLRFIPPLPRSTFPSSLLVIRFLLKFVDRFQFWLKSDSNDGQFTWRPSLTL